MLRIWREHAIFKFLPTSNDKKIKKTRMGGSLLMNKRKIEDGHNEYDQSQKDQESSTNSPDRQAA